MNNKKLKFISSGTIENDFKEIKDDWKIQYNIGIDYGYRLANTVANIIHTSIS